MDVRALREQAHQISELTKHPGWGVYTDYLEWQVMAPLKKQVLNDSGVTSLEDYKKLAGFLAGVHRALDVPAEVVRLVETAAGIIEPPDEAA